MLRRKLISLCRFDIRGFRRRRSWLVPELGSWAVCRPRPGRSVDRQGARLVVEGRNLDRVGFLHDKSSRGTDPNQLVIDERPLYVNFFVFGKSV
ncbi:MAG: hypothetical protein ACJ8F7_09870, partial [Gemmataceae bacterium]